MIGLIRKRPQRGKGGFRNLERLAGDFDLLFAKYCQDVPQGRVTGERPFRAFSSRRRMRTAGGWRR
jgi:hypothetical protein